MQSLSGGWKQIQIGVYEKRIGARDYRITCLKHGYYDVSWLNPAEIMGYFRRVDSYGSFEVATLAAEVHSAQYWQKG